MDRLNNTDFFADFFENRPSKIVSLIFSVSGILCLTPLFYAVIWYERFGNDNRRTLVSVSTYFFDKKARPFPAIAMYDVKAVIQSTIK